MKKLTGFIVAIIAAFGLVAAPLAPTAVHAGSPTDSISEGVNAVGGGSGSKAPSAADFNKGIKNVVDTMLFLLGAIAVIMIIIGGIRYATSNGDASSTKAAKDTILYAVVGLVVAILAYAIVNFVLTAFTAK